MSVPRREGKSKQCESDAQQRSDVPAETAASHEEAQKKGSPKAEIRFSTGVRSADRNKLSRRCVSCVSSAVALRKREVRKRELRISEWRQDVVLSAYPPASPKDTLARVFKQMQRAARLKKSQRIAERLAPKFKRSDFLFCVPGKA